MASASTISNKRRSGAASSSSLQGMTLKLSVLETRRDEKRQQIQDLYEQKKLVEEKMARIEAELEKLDNDIDELEADIQQGEASASSRPVREVQVPVKKEPNLDQEEDDDDIVVVSEERGHSTERRRDHDDEVLTDPLMMTQTQHPDEHIPDETAVSSSGGGFDYYRPPSSRGSSVGQLEISARERQPRTKPPPPSPPPAMQQEAGESSQSHHSSFSYSPPSQQQQEFSASNNVPPAAASAARPQNKNRTLDDYFRSSSSANGAGVAARGLGALASATDVSHASVQQQHQHRPSSSNNQFAHSLASNMNNRDPNARFRLDNFPWSADVNRLLVNTFRIPSFRDHQKEIINATLTGDDVFVIMRTGGGKSLTYQLPALIEGRGRDRKVTFVISPLLSLIQDQEDQMNQFARGSAISFTSGMKGGTSEHARRWESVRDPSSGVCLVFVTPEKVSKSNKLCSEMDKLNAAGRLGRFVIDESHCASNWGHDFRPDYAQLGKLKSHFPHIPIIAVTATASDQVREDVCRILRIGTDYRFFRSTANRPNLTYSVVPKPDGKGAAVDAMAAFIKEKHPQSAGIVYTLSRKDAETVASDLCDLGVVARAYHSDVSPTKKEQIHRSWMRNDTQVVVATIAFGLGINKPDVSFVLHHSISKTLEAYYQESGRAGRDGSSADCVLFYSPKDFTRMLKMVHGTSSEQLLWPMVRYAQQSGNDAVCRAVIMTHLGEPDSPDVLEVCRQNSGTTTTRRDVGLHAQTAVRLLILKLGQGEKITPAMLVRDWRAKGDKAVQCVKDNPPAKDGLSTDDCERIIVSLMLEGIIEVNPKWTAYDTIIYLKLGHHAQRFSQSSEPRFVVDLPNRPTQTATKASQKAKARKSVAMDGEGWLSAKSRATTTKRKKTTATKKKPAKKAKTTKTKSKTSSKKAAPKAIRASSKTASTRQKAAPKDLEIIELSSGDDEGDEDLDRKPSARTIKAEDEESESEFEFDM